MNRMNTSFLAEAEAFLGVIEHGGFGAAAQALNVRQSTISRRVAHLEHRLSQRLLERTTRTILLTPAGEQYAAGLRDTLMRLHELENAISGQALECAGPLKITAPLIYGRSRLVPLIGELITAYPKLELQLELTDREVDIIAGEADIALRFTEPRQPGIETKRIGEARVLICASPALLTEQPISGPADLAKRRCIASPTFLPRIVWNLQTGGRRIPVSLDPLLVVSDPGFRRDLAVQGCGVVALPEFVVLDDIAAGRLQEVLTGVTLPPIPLLVMWARHRRALPSIVVVRQLLQERLGP